MLTLKYEYDEKNKKGDPKSEETMRKEKSYIYTLDDGRVRKAKLTTNKLIKEIDKYDPQRIKSIKNICIVYEWDGGKCLELRGNLSCDFFSTPYGGKFFIRGAYLKDLNYSSVGGVEKEIRFDDRVPTPCGAMSEILKDLTNDPSFVYNVTQFEEFMQLFGFYKELSAELNNNARFEIIGVSKKYYFAPISLKEYNDFEENDRVLNQDGIVIGHRVEDYKYAFLDDDAREQIRELIDIKIKGDEKTVKKIKRFSEDLYANDIDTITEDKTRELRGFELVNISRDGDTIILSGETDVESLKYLHLYDMGQKIKLDSINNSLRLINEGETGSAKELLEYIIGGADMPNGNASKNMLKKSKYMKGLDESQKKAFLMSTDGAPVSLIKGPPGTGKTHVINAIVQYITKELGEKVVISSQTHVAIDNVLDKLMENHDLIIPNRITNRRNKYSGKEINTTLYKTWATNFDKHNALSRRKTIARGVAEDMKAFSGEKRFAYSDNPDAEYSVIGATTTTSAIAGKKGLEVLQGYDWLIIDEVSKCPITEVLRYLPYVNHVIMVGDDYQLAPLLEFSEDEVSELAAYDENMFKRLKTLYENSVFSKTLEKAKKAGRLAILSTNYRSVKDVLWAYNVFYDHILENKRESVRTEKVRFDNTFQMLNEKDIFFVDVQYGKEVKEGKSRYNVEEMHATASILRDVIDHTENAHTVSVAAIFPYASQIKLFKQENKELINEAKQKFASFDIDTVDAFQGKEADVVLVNTVVTTPKKTFLEDFRRINVSMSRARDKLFVFGNPTTLRQIRMSASDCEKRTYFAEILRHIEKCGGRYKYDYKEGIHYAN